MGFRKLFAAVAVCLLVVPASEGAHAEPMEIATDLDRVRQPDGLLAIEPQAYQEVTQPDQSPPPYVEPYHSDEPFEENYGAAVSCCDVCGCGDDCACATNYRSGWTLGFDASALQSEMATRDVDAWPDDFGAAGRVTLGYEWDSGFGIRTQAWGYSLLGAAHNQYYIYNYNSPYYFIDYDYWYPAPVSATYSRDIELSAATVYLDFYKAVFSRRGELLVGVGPAFGHLEFNSPPAGDGAKYHGGGVSVVGQGFYPLYQRRRWELAFSGQARVALLTGQWELDFVTTSTEHSASMSILELGFGPEIRRRFGRHADSFWFVRTLAEFQQWRSDRMGPMGGDTLALQGATVNFGVSW